MRKVTTSECITLPSIHRLPTQYFDTTARANKCQLVSQYGGMHISLLWNLYAEHESKPILVLQFRVHGKTSRHRTQTITLVKNPLPSGGVRYWLTCPLCGRRRNKLFLPPRSDSSFGCRSCYDLSYRSRQTRKSKSVLDWDLEDESSVHDSL
jgi:hypothetical protein